MADEMIDPVEAQTEVSEPALKMDAKDAEKWRARIKAAKQRTEMYVREWRDNIEYRRGKPFETASDQDRIAVNPDWPNTKAKQAQLFSQITPIILSPKMAGIPSLAAAVPPFAKELNETLIEAGTEAAMDECMPDLINAAGVAAVNIWFERKAQQVKLPKDPLAKTTTLSPEEIQIAVDNDLVPTVYGNRPGDSRFVVERLSPGDLLWDKNFKASDFNKANWVGRRGRITIAEAMGRNWVTEEEKDKVVASANQLRSGWDQLNENPEDTDDGNDELVEFFEVFYWRYKYHSDEPYFKAIQHVVFVEGKDDAVINEPWAGQKFDEASGTYVGSCKFPIQFVTLTYLTDEAIPPSDSAIGRPQVDELIQSRTDIMLNRRHSRPLRTGDVTRIDQLVLDAIGRGEFQGIVPVIGNGEKVFTEIARASYPAEDFRFDSIAKDDLREAWQVGSNQLGTATTGETSASEANIVQQNFQTRIGYERARVAKFYVNIAEVVGGLLALHGNFEVPEVSPEDAKRLGGWDKTRLGTEFVYTIRKDSTVLLDAEQRFTRLDKFLNKTAGSGYVEVEPIIREMAELATLDPDKIVRKPAPKGLDPANVSLRIGGAQDLADPMTLAILSLMGLLPNPDQIRIAQEAIMLANPMGIQSPATQAAGPMDPNAKPGAPPSPEQPAGPEEGSAGWDVMSRIDKRSSNSEDKL